MPDVGTFVMWSNPYWVDQSLNKSRIHSAFAIVIAIGSPYEIILGARSHWYLLSFVSTLNDMVSKGSINEIYLGGNAMT